VDGFTQGRVGQLLSPLQDGQACSTKPQVFVAAGMILREDGYLLLGQRPQGKSWEGWWELPGGKIEPGETVYQALVRELHEELNITVTHATPWVRYVYEYEKTMAHLHLWRVTGWKGIAAGQENQALAWVDPQREPVAVAPLLPATLAPLRWIRLPQRYLLTSITQANHLPAYLQDLDRRLTSGAPCLVQFREPQWQDGLTQAIAPMHPDAKTAPDIQINALHQAFTQVLACCRRHGVPCLVNSVHPKAWWSQADGVHLRAQDAEILRNQGFQRPQGLLGVSSHNDHELGVARALNADFAVLGHVLPTASHPGMPGMGWQAFARHAQTAGLPVYAVGGQGEDTLGTAQKHGAHGVAGIRGLFRHG